MSSIVQSDNEKNQLLQAFGQLRSDSTFCDAALLCRGKLFRVHRVVVGAWSRWLYALLSETPSDEVVSLDVFDPNALESVLDYMYGQPLSLNVDTADATIKVLRRLELTLLEQQCWRYLMTVIDTHNCEFLHELAERYDCPPLKLTAWRILQEMIPGYSRKPIYANNQKLEIEDSSNGLTGPGELPFIQGYENNGYEEDYDEDLPSIFDKIKNIENENPDVEEEVYEVDNLPINATASDVVKAWGNKLFKIYKECTPKDGEANIMSAFSNVEASSDTIKRITNQSPKKGGGSPLKVFTPIHTSHTKPVVDIDWRNELRRFYLAINHPEKVTGIEDILKMWVGKEDQMLSSLLTKYKKIIPQDVYERLDQLHQLIESQIMAD